MTTDREYAAALVGVGLMALGFGWAMSDWIAVTLGFLCIGGAAGFAHPEDM